MSFDQPWREPATIVPETRYTRSGGVHIAYQAFGGGPPDLAFVAGFTSHCEHQWEQPALAASLRRMASFSRLVWFDKRGTGLSDPVPPDQLSLELRMLDMNAVLDAVGSSRAALVRRELDRYGGHEVKTVGDGFVATFDGPARAVRCAQAIADGVRQLGLEVRAGVHTGEVELLDGDIGGIAVHIAARVNALAAPGEVLVSRTVKDLVAGSGIGFVDRGSHALKGIPEDWQLLAASAA
jgi:plasmid stabilization system protein ParE